MVIAATQTDLPLGFRYTEEQSLIQETIRDLAQKEFAPRAAEVDKNHRFPRENWELLGQSDVCGLVFPEQYGGAGLDAVCYSIVVEELAKTCATTSVLYSAHVSLCAKPIYIFGTEEQKQKFLTPMCKGEKTWRLCSFRTRLWFRRRICQVHGYSEGRPVHSQWFQKLDH